MTAHRIRIKEPDGTVSVRDFSFSQMVELLDGVGSTDAVAFEFDGAEVVNGRGQSLHFMGHY